MIRRALLPALLAGLLSFAFPTTAQAVVVDEAADTRFPDVNGNVLTIAHKGNTVYIGGSFTRISGPNGRFVRRGAAAFDIRNGRVLPWNPKVVGTVNDIAVARKNVFLGGKFRRVGNKPRANLALVRAGGKAKLSTWKVPVSGHIRTMDVAGKKLYLGGPFTAVNRVKRSGLAAITVRNGKVLKWRPTTNGAVYDIEFSSTGVYLAGAFTRVSTTPVANRLGQVAKAGTGRTISTFGTRRPTDPVGDPVLDVVVTGTRVYAAVGGNEGGALMAVERADGSVSWERRLDGDGQAVAVLGETIYVGGHFSNRCTNPDPQQDATGTCLNGSVPAGRMAAFDGGGTAIDWNPMMNSEVGVKALDTYASIGRLVAGGGFTRSGADATTRLAVFRATN